VITRGRRPRRTEDKGSWIRNSCVICSVEDAKKHRTGEKKKQQEEEQKE